MKIKNKLTIIPNEIIVDDIIKNTEKIALVIDPILLVNILTTSELRLLI